MSNSAGLVIFRNYKHQTLQNPSKPPKPSNPYLYSEIVLCVKTSITDFNCYKFDSYDDADKYFTPLHI